MRAWIAGSFLILSGCNFGNQEADVPGTSLGTFEITATQTETTCGEGALGSLETWTFEAELSREGDVIYWNSPDGSIEGTVDEEGSFSFSTQMVVNMRTDSESPPCSVERTDVMTGVLEGTETDVSSFAGTLQYAFAATSGSECSDLIEGAEAVFQQLPCEMVYEVVAVRE